MTDLAESSRLALISGTDAVDDARTLLDRIEAEGMEVTHEHMPIVPGQVWPSLALIEDLRFSPDTPVFLLSPALVAAIEGNKVFAEAIYEMVARGKPVFLVFATARAPIPSCFLSTAGVDVDQFSPLHVTRTPKKRPRNRTDVKDVVQRKEPGRSVSLLVPTLGGQPNSLGYEVVDVVDRINANDRALIAAFVIDDFRIAKACDDILSHYPDWKSARVRSAIVKKPRDKNLDKTATLKNIASRLDIPPESVLFLDDYIRRKTPSFKEAGISGEGPRFVYVPIECKFKLESQRATKQPDAQKVLEEWRNLPDSQVLLISGEGGTGKTHVVMGTSDNWNRGTEVRAYSIDSQNFVHAFADRLASSRSIEVFDIYRAAHRGEDQLSRESFYDQWTNGNFILIIDGIDEIANRAPGAFSIASFLDDVLSADTEGFGKLILTAREFLVTDEVKERIAICELEEFDERRAESFFDITYTEHFPDEKKRSRLVRKSMKDAASLKRGNHKYVPYVLSLIAESYTEGDEEAESFADLEGEEEADSTGFIIQRICQREARRIKDDRIQVEQQLRIFELLSAERAPGVSYEKYSRLIGRIVPGKVSDNVERFLRSHLLLSQTPVGAGQSLIWFRYDFHAEYFLAGLVARQVSSNATHFGTSAAGRLPPSAAAALADHRGFDDPMIELIAQPLRRLSYDELVQGVLTTMEQPSSIDSLEKQQADAALFNIALRKELVVGGSIVPAQHAMTRLAVDLFGQNGGKTIVGLRVSRIPQQQGRKITIDFSGLSLEGCSFEEWHDFFSCPADAMTRFTACRVTGCGTKGPTALTEKMFDASSLDDAAQARFLTVKATKETTSEAVRETLRRFFMEFQSGVGAFRGHASKSWFFGSGYASMRTAHLIGAQKFASILIRAGAIQEREDKRKGHYVIPAGFQADVNEFINQSREKRSVRELIKKLTDAAR